jgi:hypothetical protein
MLTRKETLVEWISKSLHAALTPQNIASGFRTARIYPFDMTKLDGKIHHLQPLKRNTCKTTSPQRHSPLKNYKNNTIHAKSLMRHASSIMWKESQIQTLRSTWEAKATVCQARALPLIEMGRITLPQSYHCQPCPHPPLTKAAASNLL